MWKLLACCVITLGAVVAGDFLRDIPGQGPLAKKFERVVDSIHSLEKEVLQAGSVDWPPKFCKNLDCPKFDVLEKHAEYEVRQYGPSRWVSTTMTGLDYDQAAYTLFIRLFHYIKGKNSKGVTMDMGVPVTLQIIPGQSAASESNFTMSFFVPPTVSDPPQPKNANVFLTSSNGGKVYVRSFSGFAHMTNWLNEAAALAKVLPANTKYVKDYYYSAGYDAPFTFLNRHTEIWFVAE